MGPRTSDMLMIRQETASSLAMGNPHKKTCNDAEEAKSNSEGVIATEP